MTLVLKRVCMLSILFWFRQTRLFECLVLNHWPKKSFEAVDTLVYVSGLLVSLIPHTHTYSKACTHLAHKHTYNNPVKLFLQNVTTTANAA